MTAANFRSSIPLATVRLLTLRSQFAGRVEGGLQRFGRGPALRRRQVRVPRHFLTSRARILRGSTLHFRLLFSCSDRGTADVAFDRDSTANEFYRLIAEIFEIKGVFKWFRKTFIIFVKVTFGKSVNRQEWRKAFCTNVFETEYY